MATIFSISFSQKSGTYLSTIGRGDRSNLVNRLVEEHIDELQAEAPNEEEARIEFVRQTAAETAAKKAERKERERIAAERAAREKVEEEARAAEERAKAERVSKERNELSEKRNALLVEWKERDLKIATLLSENKKKQDALPHADAKLIGEAYSLGERRKALRQEFVSKGLPAEFLVSNQANPTSPTPDQTKEK